MSWFQNLLLASRKCRAQPNKKTSLFPLVMRVATWCGLLSFPSGVEDRRDDDSMRDLTREITTISRDCPWVTLRSVTSSPLVCAVKDLRIRTCNLKLSHCLIKQLKYKLYSHLLRVNWCYQNVCWSNRLCQPDGEFGYLARLICIEERERFRIPFNLRALLAPNKRTLDGCVEDASVVDAIQQIILHAQAAAFNRGLCRKVIWYNEKFMWCCYLNSPILSHARSWTGRQSSWGGGCRSRPGTSQTIVRGEGCCKRSNSMD